MSSAISHHARHEAGMVVAASEHRPDVDLDGLEAQYTQEVRVLRTTFESGKTKNVEWRKNQIRAIRRAFVEANDEIVQAVKADLGRHSFEGVFLESAQVILEADHMLENLDSWVAPKHVSHPLIVQPGSSELHYTPKGVVFILSPWNYPINLTFMALLAVIAAGNCAVIKPSEVAPASAVVIEKLVHKYLDNDCVKVIQGAVPETTALLRIPFDHIIYTGNGAVGRIVATAAAKHLTPITLELGGKSPVYVDKSCNLKVTAKRLLLGKCLNTGQTCIAPDHVLVDKAVEKPLIKELVATAKSFYGNDIASSDSFGRIVNHRHFDRIMRLLDPNSHRGNVVLGGPEHAERSQKLLPLTLVQNPSVDSPLMHEEIFGPVLPIVPVDGPEDAVRFITAREHPLALYIFASDQKIIDYILANTQAGGVCVNDTMMHIGNSELPFGGVGASGLGKYHGIFGFQEFSHARSVMYRSTWLDPSMRYPPYSESKAAAVKAFISKEPMSATTKKLLLAAGAGAAGMFLMSKM